ncbi:urease accessory protein UreD [Ramlibacter solisilvae]|uniref:Urease accessory protein UreD n=1 Tax=Ramlibacter tataouinensis TaxID=94132 RepID=A0A127JQV8_9BURK|nr:urease accessory protein UreD [Ramlibacter tataouinensis]AMO22356.1 urease accessory protein ureD [Ramlibacter tataouinensis]
MTWQARLDLDYSADGARTVARHAHEGPLRILQTLYPEGHAIAHNVLVHPPSGLVGGDLLDITVRAGAGSHGLITTPGAARFYRSEGAMAVQRAKVALAPGARLEWLPQETLCYSGCIAENHLIIDLAPGAEFMGWDITALGLPASELPFTRGSLLQHLEVTGSWLERGRIAAGDERLLDGPLGLAGHRCFGALFFASHEPLARARREQALGLAHEVIAQQAEGGVVAGVTAPAPNVIVVRALATMVEPAATLLRAVRAAWRPLLWELPATAPRVWSV